MGIPVFIVRKYSGVVTHSRTHVYPDTAHGFPVITWMFLLKTLTRQELLSTCLSRQKHGQKHECPVEKNIAVSLKARLPKIPSKIVIAACPLSCRILNVHMLSRRNMIVHVPSKHDCPLSRLSHKKTTVDFV